MRSKHGTLVVFASGLILFATVLLAQTTKKSFEAASVKLNVRPIPASNMGNFMVFPGGRLSAEGPLLRLILDAYQIRGDELVGAPEWINSTRYEIEATANDPSMNIEQVWPLFRSLLEDRFQLTTHRETRQLPVYELSVAKSGSKMRTYREGTCFPQPSNGPPIPPPPPVAGGTAPPPPCGRVYMGMFDGKASLTGRQASVAEFVRVLANVLGRTVIDKTDLNGSFDFDLPFAPDTELEGLPGGPALPISADPNTGATIFTAIQEQLGLKLESTKGAVQVIVIDGIQKPSEN